MNHFIEYVFRGVIRSEDAIRNLNKHVVSLAKCNKNLTGSIICFGIAGILMTAVVAEHDKEIKALKKQVSELAKAVDTTKNVEEQNEQEGA